MNHLVLGGRVIVDKTFIFIGPDGSGFQCAVISEINGKFIFIKKQAAEDVDEVVKISKAWPESVVYCTFEGYEADIKFQVIQYSYMYGWYVEEFKKGEFNFINFVLDFVGVRL